MAISAAMKASACEPPAASQRASRPEQPRLPLRLLAAEVSTAAWAVAFACRGVYEVVPLGAL